MELMQASHEWATRPDDQRFLTLAELKASVGQRKKESWTAIPNTRDLRVIPDNENNRIALECYDPTTASQRRLNPSHWAFGQLASYASAPAAYLRKLPAQLVAINLQWGLERSPMRDDALVLGQTNGHDTLRAMTSTSYGRIWDSHVVDAVEKVNHDGRWKVPAASYSTQNPRRATTLYASDRDVFIFLVDPDHPIDVGGETLFRGFYAWNSEVGSATFGLMTFLYRYVCDNRIVWGATEINELKIRHTGGAPERFAYEGAKYLKKYAEENTYKAVESIKSAKGYEIPNAKEKNGVETWLQSRGFTSTIAKASVQAAVAEEGQARSLWDIINGVTAHARSIPHTDERVQLEAQAGKLMALVS